MPLVSIIIPSKSSRNLQKTIDCVLKKAENDIEIIVVLDGYWPNPIINPDPRVIIVHHGTIHHSYGRRESIKKGMSLARGTYVMKLDEKYMMKPGFDVKLAKELQKIRMKTRNAKGIPVLVDFATF